MLFIPVLRPSRQTKRAEQNRKAQQNFRKRREENIKLLEAKVAEFDELKKQKDLTDGVIGELRMVGFCCLYSLRYFTSAPLTVFDVLWGFSPS
jgi:hypothetical protein